MVVLCVCVVPYWDQQEKETIRCQKVIKDESALKSTEESGIIDVWVHVGPITGH